MAKRQIIRIDEEKCTGCGLCVPNCAEGALQIVDGKARLISDLFCDGLGACIGHCPEDAITIETREAKPYDEKHVMEKNIVPAGENTIKKHLEHLYEHGAKQYFNEAMTYLKEHNLPIPHLEKSSCSVGACRGSTMREFSPTGIEQPASDDVTPHSQLRQWPIQLHLISPAAPYLKNADLLVAADCSAFAAGEFHTAYLRGKILAIACPKLDSRQDEYRQKITAMIDQSKINSITAVIMEVPCCGGLLEIVTDALRKAGRKVPVKKIVLSLKGDKLSEEWL